MPGPGPGPLVLRTPVARNFHLAWEDASAAGARRLVLDTGERALLWPDGTAAVLAGGGGGAGRTAGCFGCSRPHSAANLRCTLDPRAARRLQSGCVPVPHGCHHTAWCALSRRLVGGLALRARPRAHTDYQSAVRIYDHTRWVPTRGAGR
jgi:hypothetical protein